jgi:hypothetical protein
MREAGKTYDAIAAELTAAKILSPLGKPSWQPSTVRRIYNSAHVPAGEPTCKGHGDQRRSGVMAYIRKCETGQLDKFGNPLVSYQVVWREPVRDEFGAPMGKLKQTSETFPTERKAKAHQRKVENELESAAGVSPSSQKAKANLSLGHYAKQYLDGLVGTVDDSTIEGYEKIYRTHIGPVFGSRPVAFHYHRGRHSVSGSSTSSAQGSS